MQRLDTEGFNDAPAIIFVANIGSADGQSFGK